MRIGDDKRIRGNGERFRGGISKPFQHRIGNAEGTRSDFGVRAPRRADAQLALPFETLRRHPVRTRHIAQRPILLGDILQIEPGLRRRVEGVHVKRVLRIGPRSVAFRQNGLEMDERLAAAARHIAKEVRDPGARHELFQRRAAFYIRQIEAAAPRYRGAFSALP